MQLGELPTRDPTCAQGPGARAVLQPGVSAVRSQLHSPSDVTDASSDLFKW